MFFHPLFIPSLLFMLFGLGVFFHPRLLEIWINWMTHRVFLFILGILVTLLGVWVLYLSGMVRFRALNVCLGVYFIMEGSLYLVMPRKIEDLIIQWKMYSQGIYKMFSFVFIVLGILLGMAALPLT